jgi:hypothetical protein
VAPGSISRRPAPVTRRTPDRSQEGPTVQISRGRSYFCRYCPNSGVRDGYRLAFDVCSKAFTRDCRVQAALSRCPAGRQGKARWRHSDPEQPPGGGRDRQLESGFLQRRVTNEPASTSSTGATPFSIRNNCRRSVRAPLTFLLICLSASVPAQLLKLGVERLPVGADAGIAEAAGFGGWLGLSFQVGSGHPLWKS